MRWPRIGVSTLLAYLLFCSVCLGQITVTPSKANVGQKVVATVSATVPDGATFDGGWSVTCDSGTCRVEVEPLEKKNSIGLWGPAGNYQLIYSGFWLLLKEVKFKDFDGNEVVIQSYLGHGFINEKVAFTLEGENGPDPPVGPWNVVMFYRSATLDDATQEQQAMLRGEKIKEQLQSKGHVLMERVQGIPSSYPVRLKPFVEAVKDDTQFPRVAIQHTDGGAILDFQMPGTIAGLMATLDDPRLEEALK